MTGAEHARLDSARAQILRAAVDQFARRPYHLVSLDDILAQAKVTKGSMYFHFRSKHALAVAIVEARTTQARIAIEEILSHRLSGLETLIDATYLLVLRDLTDTTTRAALYLVDAIGRTEGLQSSLVDEWLGLFTTWAHRAHHDGDLLATAVPADVARLVIALHVGLRHIEDLDAPERYLRSFSTLWLQMLPGVVVPERVDYFERFVGRRTVVALRTVRS